MDFVHLLDKLKYHCTVKYIDTVARKTVCVYVCICV